MTPMGYLTPNDVLLIVLSILCLVSVGMAIGLWLAGRAAPPPGLQALADHLAARRRLLTEEERESGPARVGVVNWNDVDRAGRRTELDALEVAFLATRGDDDDDGCRITIINTGGS